MNRWGFAAVIVILLLSYSSVSATTWYIKANGTGDVPTIQAGVEAAEHGDTVLVAAGTYSWNNQGTGNGFGMIHILRGSADMTIRSESGPEVTILNGQGQGRIMFFQGETELTVEGFTFQGGVGTSTGNFVGGGFSAHLSSPVVRDCIFRNNSAANQGGAYWYGGVGAPQIIRCVFENNFSSLGGALFLINSPSPSLVSDCVIRNNEASGEGGGGIFCYNFQVTIENTIFANNTAGLHGGGVFFVSSHPSTFRSCTFYNNAAPTGGGISSTGNTIITAENTIVAFSGQGDGAHADPGSAINLSCSDIFGNLGGDWVGEIASQLGINGNISDDPLFCDATGSGYELDADSPCAPGNHPDGVACGVIGARPVACGGVPTETRSWGAIKAIYRE